MSATHASKFLRNELLVVSDGGCGGAGGDADGEPFGGSLEAQRECSAVRDGGGGVAFVQEGGGSVFFV